jgi:hypothetical protein
LLVFAIYRHAFPFQSGLLRSAFHSRGKFQALLDTRTGNFKFSRWLAWVIIVLLCSVIAYTLLPSTVTVTFNLSRLMIFVSIASFITVYFTSLYLIRLVIGNALIGNEFSAEFSTINRVYWFSISLISLPLFLLIYYNTHSADVLASTILALLVVSLVNLLSMFRFGMREQVKRLDSYFFLIIYLCTFEILPLLVLVKFLSLTIFNG